MSHRIIARQRGCGKTTELLQSVIDTLEQDADVDIIVPDGRQHEMLDRVRRAGLVGVRVLSAGGSDLQRTLRGRRPTFVDNFDMIEPNAQLAIMRWTDVRVITETI